MINKLKFFLLLLAAACSSDTPTDISTQTTSETYANAEKSATLAAKKSVPGTDPEIQPLLIQVEQIGAIRKGMAANELYSQFDSTRIHKKKEKQGGITYAVYKDAINPDVICTASDGENIDAIIIQSSAYKTAKGIGVGNTFRELANLYHVAQVQVNKHQQILIQVEELQRKQFRPNQEVFTGVLFELGLDAAGLVQTNRAISPSAIPPDAIIVRIFL